MAITTLTNTTWVFNETITNTTTADYRINFTSNNENFTTFKLASWGTPVLGYDNSASAYYNGWNNEAYRTITIINGEDVENEKLISFLQSNAVLKQITSLKEYLTAIADAIREKKKTSEPINAQHFANEIASIEGGYTFNNFIIDRQGDMSSLCKVGDTTTNQNAVNQIDWERIKNLNNLSCAEMFRNNDNITEITIDDAGATENKIISCREMFEDCNNLKKAILKITGLSGFYKTFYKCENIETIRLSQYRGTSVIGDGFDSGYMAFSFCANLKTLIIEQISTIDYSLDSNAFSDCLRINNGTGKIYVPDNMVNTLKSATNWAKIAYCIKPLSEYVEE